MFIRIRSFFRSRCINFVAKCRNMIYIFAKGGSVNVTLDNV